MGRRKLNRMTQSPPTVRMLWKSFEALLMTDRSERLLQLKGIQIGETVQHSSTLASDTLSRMMVEAYTHKRQSALLNSGIVIGWSCSFFTRFLFARRNKYLCRPHAATQSLASHTRPRLTICKQLHRRRVRVIEASRNDACDVRPRDTRQNVPEERGTFSPVSTE